MVVILLLSWRDCLGVRDSEGLHAMDRLVARLPEAAMVKKILCILHLFFKKILNSTVFLNHNILVYQCQSIIQYFGG